MNVQILIAIVIILIAVTIGIVTFIKCPTELKVKNVKEWLKWAVTQAEKELGSGTGQLKLHKVYSMALQQFPWIAKIISFETFSTWVDEALDWMKEQLSKNNATKNYIENK